MMTSGITGRSMTRQELTTLVEWAVLEGWNPGKHDADIFWETDPDGFVALEADGVMVGGISIVSYDGRYGFTGLLIVRPEFRGKRYGAELCALATKTLQKRFRPEVAVGLDGVYAMQYYYAKQGFDYVYRNIRFEGIGQPSGRAAYLRNLSDLSFEEVLAYDTRHFSVPRPKFLKPWIAQAGALALGAVHDNHLTGMGVIRPCVRGYKIGPLFADTREIAQDLFASLASFADGQPMFLDVPEVNSAGLDLANRHNMKEVFGCARMYRGPAPALPLPEIFGVTTFELG